MQGFPITYGDHLSYQDSNARIISTCKGLSVYIAVIMISACVAYAAESNPSNNNNGLAAKQADVKTAERIVAATGCVSAGSACANPKTKTAFLVCGLFLGWFAAKSSPI
jgi:hypothetical protein